MSAPPILSFPPEITQHIMAMTLPSTGNPHPVTSEAPLIFTRVCRDWRNISLNTPELWQSIAVDMSTRTVHPEVVSLWGSRAGILPRNIHLVTLDHERAEQLLEESMESCERWQHVDLALPLECFAALDGHHGPFPMLRSLSLLIFSGIIDGKRTITIRDAFLLREVTLGEHPFLTVEMAWEQLTTLKITANIGKDGISLLQRCINLIELELKLVDKPAPSTIPPFALPSLQSLVTQSQSVLPFLTVPSLTRLDISGPGFSGEIEELTTSLRALLERSRCPLECLSFRVPPISAAELRHFLKAAPPSVVFLQLSIFLSDQLGVTSALQAIDVLPRLKTLHIDHPAGLRDTYDGLLDTLRSRRQVIEGRATLEAFHLYNPPTHPGQLRVYFPDALRSKLSALQEEGLHVHIVE
ncbi:hypothetical protein B0H11DRAFT_2067459 [Mycena galericulata]|nr:hypothetical protein B0H11DRAFT_2067459 [Mycena galericulata]